MSHESIELAFRTGFEVAWAATEGGPPGSLHAVQDEAWANYRTQAGGVLVASHMTRVIDRLLAEAPPLLDANGAPVPDQAPALDCVVMFSFGQTIRGSLSRTPEGALRMMSPGTDNGRGVLVEQFFDDSVVASVALVREIKTDARRLFVPAGSVIS
jgi:hypothetical protein